jgi:hypothetical protein
VAELQFFRHGFRLSHDFNPLDAPISQGMTRALSIL